MKNLSTHPQRTVQKKARTGTAPPHYMSMLIKTTLLLLVSICWLNSALALKSPMKLGDHKVGHTTLLFTDPTRNRDGSVPESGEPEGRPLLVHIWYPRIASCPSCQITNYSANNDIYDGTHEGYPLIKASRYTQSTNGVLEDATIKNSTFPLIMYSHGSTGNPTNEMITLQETLASHGYIVAGVEHTGNSSIRSMGYLRDPIIVSPAMGTGVDRMIRRAQDVSFTIDQMLGNPVAANFTTHIDANKIGLYGYSLGGGTTMMVTAGLASAGLDRDPRVKAAIPMDGTDYVGFSNDDISNIQVPMMLYQDSNRGENNYYFPLLINSHPKYLVDISAAEHLIATLWDMCEVNRANLVDLQANPDDPDVLATALFEFFGDESYMVCKPTLFKGISDATLEKLGIDPAEVAAMKEVMPLRTEASLNAFERAGKQYVISFFNVELKGLNHYARFLEDSKRNQKVHPLVALSKDCRYDPDRPMDLQAGDKITFTPHWDKYRIRFSSGNSLVDKGDNLLPLGDDDAIQVDLPFSFKMPTTKSFDRLRISSNGIIQVSNMDRVFDYDPAPLTDYSYMSPWMMRGEMLLNGQPTIAALLNDLDPTADGAGIYVRSESDHVVITYDQVPVYGGIPGVETNTMQVVIHKNGVIEMTYGDMIGYGPVYQPEWTGIVGISTGRAKASELRTGEVDYSSISDKIYRRSSFEPFYFNVGGTEPCQ